MNLIFPLLLLSISLISLTTAFKNGSPAHVCLSPYPHHKPSKYEDNFSSQPLNTSPVTVQLSSNTYGSSKTPIKIFIKTIGESYKGLIMLIRSTIPVTQVPIGEFTSCNSTAIKFLKAESNKTNCLTHSDSKPKPATIMCTWQPPYLENYGNLELVLSVAQSFSVFWVDLKYPILYDNLKSLPYNYPSYMKPPQTSAVTISNLADFTMIPEQHLLKVNKKMKAFSTSKCGVDRHCLLYPPNCKLTSSCLYMVNVQDLGPNGVAFELVSPLDGYFGFGISPLDRRAHEAFVTICRTNSKTKAVTFSNGDTQKHYLFENLKKWITDRQAGVDPSWMGRVAKVCRYNISSKEMEFRTNKRATVVSLMDDMYYYFVVGKLFHATDYILGHSENPLKSNGKITLLSSEYSTHYLSSFIVAEKFHATIMILAWVLLIPIGTMIPRYFKNVWTMTYVQKVLWLLSHMVTVIVGVLISIISYILILVINNGWRYVSTIHGVFGTLTICAGLLNIAIGFNRPDPKSEKRPLFNNVHFLVALSSKFFSYLTFWMILLSWRMRSQFIIASGVINLIWNLGEICFYFSSFYFRADKTVLKIFENKQLNPPPWFIVAYVVLECLVATSLIATVWLN